jgi:NodT family efflux transporter outer membrane factor (OMF) lipoprotein
MKLSSFSSYRSAVFAALGCLLGGCAGKHEAWRDSVTVPGRWNAGGQAAGRLDPAAIRCWWERFEDPVLGGLIKQALTSSPDIKTSLAKITESRGERSVQLAGLLPSAIGNASDRIQRHDEQSTGLVTRSEMFNLSADMSWELDLFGRRFQKLQAATKDGAQTVENYYAAQVTLTAEVAAAYITLRGTQAQLDALERNVKTRQETTEITRWKQESGMSDMLEVQQATSTLEQARAAIPSLKKTISETKNQLAVLCGQSPGQLDTLLARKRPLPRVPATMATGIPAEALNNRPDVRAAVDGVLAAYHRKTVAELERLPTITLSGSIGLEALRTGTVFSPEAAARTLAGNLMAGLAQPLFEGGRITANIRISESQAKQLVYAYETTVLKALSEVENALVAIRRLSERLDVLKKADASASEATELATCQYQAGEVDLLTVLDVQRTQLAVEESRTIAEADRLKAYVQLYKSLGGGWNPL